MVEHCNRRRAIVAILGSTGALMVGSLAIDSSGASARAATDDPPTISVELRDDLLRRLRDWTGPEPVGRILPNGTPAAEQRGVDPAADPVDKARPRPMP